MCDNTISGQGENTVIDSVSRGWVWPSFQWLQSRHELLNLRQPNNTRLEKGMQQCGKYIMVMLIVSNLEELGVPTPIDNVIHSPSSRF